MCSSDLRNSPHFVMGLHPLFLLIFWNKVILKDINGDFGKLLEVEEHKGCQFLCLVFLLKSSWIKVLWRPFLYSWMRGSSSKNCITINYLSSVIFSIDLGIF